MGRALSQAPRRGACAGPLGEVFPAFEFLLPAVDPLDTRFSTTWRAAAWSCAARSAGIRARHIPHRTLRALCGPVEACKPVLAPEEIYVGSDPFRSGLGRFRSCRPKSWRSSRTAAEAALPLLAEHKEVSRKHSRPDRRPEEVPGIRETVVFLLPNPGRAERIRDILAEYEIPAALPDAVPGRCRRTGSRMVLLGWAHFMPACFFLQRSCAS